MLTSPGGVAAPRANGDFVSNDDALIAWLLDGDPSIRWQVQRDLLDAPRKTWEAERERVATNGWGKRILDLQEESGQWGGGLYSPKWVSTTYTLLQLRDMGIQAELVLLHGRDGGKTELDRMPADADMASGRLPRVMAAISAASGPWARSTRQREAI